MKHGKDFLLTNEYAKTLYSRFAACLPVIDYSCRTPYDSIKKKAPLSNVWEIWQSDERILSAMRACGTEEKYVTGDSSDYEKFNALCKCMPSLIGNPVYTLSHMALQAFFGCASEISPENCDLIWHYTADLMQRQTYTVSSLLSRINVDTVCTAADIADIPKDEKNDAQTPRVIPVVSTDKLLLTNEKDYGGDVKSLSLTLGMDIAGLASLEKALITALERWEALGCKCLRCTLSSSFRFERPDIYHAEQGLLAVLEKGRISDRSSADILASQLLRILFAQAVLRGLTVQIYLSGTNVDEVDSLLSYMKGSDILPRLIISADKRQSTTEIYFLCQKYSTSDGDMPSVIAGVGYGSLSDRAIKNELTRLAEALSLGKMAGVVTDATSPISLFAHDVFKRTLCSLLGEWMEEGRIPVDMARAGALIKAICFDNVKAFFKP